MARTGHVFSLRVPTFAEPFDRADAHKVYSNGSQALFRWCPVRLGVVRYKVPGVLTAVFRHRMPPEDYAEFLAWKASQQATTPVPSQPVDDERPAVVRKLEGGANAGRSFRAMLDKVPLDGVATVKFYAKVFPSDSKFQPKVLKLAEMDASELQQRRLSEAGLRRSSTSDVVLNENTTSLMVGMRVYVDGTKPGQCSPALS